MFVTSFVGVNMYLYLFVVISWVITFLVVMKGIRRAPKVSVLASTPTILALHSVCTSYSHVLYEVQLGPYSYLPKSSALDP